MENLLKLLSAVFIQFHWVVRKDSSTICTGRCPVLNYSALILLVWMEHTYPIWHCGLEESQALMSHAFCVYKLHLCNCCTSWSIFGLKYYGGKSWIWWILYWDALESYKILIVSKSRVPVDSYCEWHLYAGGLMLY